MAAGVYFMSTKCDQDGADGKGDPSGETSLSILPYLHNDDPASVGVGVSSWRDDDQQASHAVTCYRGGSLIEVRAVKDDPTSKALQRAGALRGALRETTKKRELKSGSTRGRVVGFSAKARRRLHLLLGKIDAGAACLFVTLTVPDTVAHDGRSMKQYLKRFKIRLAREFPAASLLWRLECKPRLSGARQGQVAGHFHGLLWGIPDQPGLQQWIAKNWSASVGDQARTQIEVPRSSRAVQAYASKLYVAKDGDQGDQIEDVGRFWGIMGVDRIPWAAGETADGLLQGILPDDV